MNVDRRRFLSRVLALWPALALPGAAARAQGFAGLAETARGFALPDPAGGFRFPRDHGPHPDFRIEWWYVTANLRSADGTDYGVQWTLFRSSLRPPDRGGDAPPQGWMGHAAISTPQMHLTTERLARGGIGQAGVTASPFAAWIDEWQLAGPSPAEMRMRASGPDFAVDLRLATDRPFVPQGRNGYSVKSAAGLASMYYSQPFLRAEGRLTLPSGPVAVTGLGWMDREWSSQPLSPEQTGWDWFSLHLDGGAKLMGYRLRDAGGGAYVAATWISPDGSPTPYDDGALGAEPLERARVAGRRIPVVWRLRLPDRGLDVTVRALRPDSWMPLSVPYWEGPVAVSGSHDGIGFLEMTGY
jgi:predicted secreted hydrolase